MYWTFAQQLRPSMQFVLPLTLPNKANNNVDSNGDTYNLYYEQVKEYYPLYSQNEGGSDVITGSGFHLVDTDNITGSGIAYTSGTVIGRPDIFSSALTVSGKTEFNHPEILGILATEEWAQTGLL